MSRTLHVCLDIEGFLKSSTFPRAYRRLFKQDDESFMSPEEARNVLFQCLREGKRVLPFEKCEEFSYETGCPGHEDGEKP